MSNLFRVAFFSVILFSVPAAASAQSSLVCALLPALCQSTPPSGGGNAVPELDGNAAGTAGALAIGAALLLATRRRREA